MTDDADDRRAAERDASWRYAHQAEQNPEMQRRIAEARAIVEEQGCFPNAMTRDEFHERYGPLASPSGPHDGVFVPSRETTFAEVRDTEIWIAA